MSEDMRQAHPLEVQSHFAALVEGSEDAIVSKDPQGMITSWNPAAARMFGFTAEEAIGQSILLVVPPELHGEEAQLLAQLRAGERIQHYETRRLRKNGTRLEVALTLSPIRDASGRVIGASAITRDITEHKRAETALRTAEKLAVTGRLAATVAHEINNPLMGISNLVYLVSGDPTLNPETRQRVSMIEQELQRVCSIARQTLGFYRDTSAPAEFLLADTVEEVLAMLDRKLLVRMISVHRDFRTDGKLMGSQGELRQVVTNLLSNAIDACPAGGKIMVRLDRGQRSHPDLQVGVRLTIGDNGCGIDPQLRHRLFEPFFTTKQEVGTGLGLWLTSKLVQKHGGAIQVRSSIRPERSGTVFSVFLPSEFALTAARKAA